jgi:antitoxin (DNA-binding transcriptional repressor) of toxin-antitoxin stability system
MHINISAAKTQLCRLVDQVNGGEEVVITRHERWLALERENAEQAAFLEKLNPCFASAMARASGRASC